MWLGGRLWPAMIVDEFLNLDAYLQYD